MKLFYTILFISAFLVSCTQKQQQEGENNDDSSRKSISIPENGYWDYMNYTFYYKGQIDNKYDIIMEIYTAKSAVSGKYKYAGKEKWISLSGSIDGMKISLEESGYDEEEGEYVTTGFFEGIFDDKGISGTWFQGNHAKSYPFQLQSMNDGDYNPLNYFVATYFYNASDYASSIEDDDFVIKELRVCNNKGEIVQTLNDFKAKRDDIESENWVEMKDVNLDGHLDILVNSGRPGYFYYCWVYNPQTQLFEQKYEYEKLGSFQVDFEKRKLYSCIHSDDDIEIKAKIYDLKNGELIIKEDREYKRGNPGYSTYKEYEEKDGKPEIIRQLKTNSSSRNLDYRNYFNQIGTGLVNYISDEMNMPSFVKIYSDAACKNLVYTYYIYAAPPDNVVPVYYFPEYGTYYFVCLGQDSNSYKIAVSENKTMYLKKGFETSFYTWEKFFNNVFCITSSDGNPFRESPEDDAPEMPDFDSCDYESDYKTDIKVVGDWLQVIVNKGRTKETGWIRWKNGNTVIIDVALDI